MMVSHASGRPVMRTILSIANLLSANQRLRIHKRRCRITISEGKEKAFQLQALVATGKRL
jgi:hypothetical protein